jgi:hypothetical protein
MAVFATVVSISMLSSDAIYVVWSVYLVIECLEGR